MGNPICHMASWFVPIISSRRRLVDTKPSSQSMLTYCPSDPKRKLKCELCFKNFQSRNTPAALISQWTSPIFCTAPFCNSMLKLMYPGICVWFIVWFVICIYYISKCIPNASNFHRLNMLRSFGIFFSARTLCQGPHLLLPRHNANVWNLCESVREPFLYGAMIRNTADTADNTSMCCRWCATGIWLEMDDYKIAITLWIYHAVRFQEGFT